MHRPAAALMLWLGYCGFVVYGSLVPLDFRPLALDAAWRYFQHTPVLAIGAEHRADWIANIVLYVPVGFLSAHALQQAWPRLPRVPLLLMGGAFSIALDVGVEFTQILFPPRTVSLNDIFAEAVGSVVGLALAARYSSWFAAALRAGPIATRRIDSRWLALYGLGYVAFNLFPYDFVVSMAELESKVGTSSWGWIAAYPSHGRALALLKLASELLLTLPIGWWLAATARRPLNRPTAVAYGALLGLGIEVTQFFMVSGTSQGLSVLSRTAGVALGAQLWQRRSQWTVAALAPLLRRRMAWLVAIHALVLLQVNQWLSAQWQSTATALQKFQELRFLPFYYHYYTTETAALASVAAVWLLYAPIGVFVWAAGRRGSLAGGLALLVCAAIETGKLFLRVHPDPTNVLIAVAAAWSTHALLEALELGVGTASGAEPVPTSQPAAVDNAATRESGVPASAGQAAGVGALRHSLWLLALALAAWGVVGFPVQRGLFGAFLAGAVVAVWLRPALVFLIVPAALPVLDLAPWSGRIYFDEFDLLLLVTFATACVRTPARPTLSLRPDPVLRAVTVLMALALAIGVARGILPWQGSEGAAFETLHGPMNALRIGKGALWALFGCALWRRSSQRGDNLWRLLSFGITTGLALTVAVIIWERATFAALLDFAGSYRVTGPISAMNTGGAYIEAFLVVATPFLIGLILEAPHWVSKLVGAALLTATVYAVMVTFSRSGYAALVVAAGVMLVASLLRPTRRVPRLAWVAGLAVLMAAVAAPALRGPFVHARAAAVDGDFTLRVKHWSDVVAMRSGDAATQLLGTGLGRFPETHYWHHDAQHRAGIFHVHREAGEPFLRLGSGDAIYVEQFVAIAPGNDYTLRLNARSSLADAEIAVSVCEKSLLTSFDCVPATVNAGPVPNQWRAVEVRFNSGTLGGGPWYSARPVKLSLHNPTQAQAFDVSDLRLQDPQGRSLLDNGDFSHGIDHWFFSTDNHLPWHVKSLPIAIWFDLGWPGVAAFGLMFGVSAVRAVRSVWCGRLHAAAPLAALGGFVVIGLFDTLIDTPRFLLVCLALCALCCAAHRDGASGA